MGKERDQIKVEVNPSAIADLFKDTKKEGRKILLALAIAKNIHAKPFEISSVDWEKGGRREHQKVSTTTDTLTAEEIAEITQLKFESVKDCLKRMLKNPQYHIKQLLRKADRRAGYTISGDTGEEFANSIISFVKEKRGIGIISRYEIALLGIFCGPLATLVAGMMCRED